MFQLLNALALRTLPVAQPEQLAAVRIAGDNPNRAGSFNGRHAVLTNPLWERIRDRQEAFSSVFAWGSPEFDLSTGGESRKVDGLWVGGEFFNTLEARPMLGRVLAAADDRRGWRRRPPSSATASGSANMAAARPRSAARSRSTATHSKSSASRRPAFSASRSVATSTWRCRCARKHSRAVRIHTWTGTMAGSSRQSADSSRAGPWRRPPRIFALSRRRCSRRRWRNTGRRTKKPIWTSGSGRSPREPASRISASTSGRCGCCWPPP